ncbi:DNA ligase [Brevibacillus sp. DP1.3A]|uniref:ATP-dependent DNA ligase n=1 Tax=Brevibacillus sp. DP1.3A TaxID=2738867 RepID=UPI00156B12FF|nr:DNA ligase [Brevibacillus sp. DP1.3A]UED77274.1 DNA ligase [Brevibacillus sp. DP1.3A]
MHPIIPMEPILCDVIPQGSDWIAQVKWDGVRILTYFDGHQTRLFNRRLNERTFHFPEVADIHSYCKARSVIVDGEIIALGPDGKPSFHEVMRRDGIRRLEKVSHVRKEVPITYMIFDVIFFDEQWINLRSLKERIHILQEIIVTNDHIQLVSNHDNGKALFTVIQQQGMEGIIMKDLNSKYVIGRKEKQWQKKKYYRDIVAVVGGVTIRDNIVNAVLLGLYDSEGRLLYIGHAGAGRLTRNDWMALTERIVPLIQKDMPFFNKPERNRGAIWLQPNVTVKVNFAEWTEGYTLRQPSIQAIVDIPTDQCVLE